MRRAWSLSVATPFASYSGRATHRRQVALFPLRLGIAQLAVRIEQPNKQGARVLAIAHDEVQPIVTFFQIHIETEHVGTQWTGAKATLVQLLAVEPDLSAAPSQEQARGHRLRGDYLGRDERLSFFFRCGQR